MPARVLLVDDEPRNLTLLEAYLSPLGYELVRAGSGQEALEAFERARPDLILLDVMMPDLDGIDVLTHVRAHDRGAYVPVILVTGLTEREDRLRGFEAGADEFLEKPVDRALLLARVRTLLRLKEAGDELVRRNLLLERLQREQREMTAFLVHDLKNQLSIAHLNIGWVKQSIEGRGHALHGLEEAHRHGVRLLAGGAADHPDRERRGPLASPARGQGRKGDLPERGEGVRVAEHRGRLDEQRVHEAGQLQRVALHEGGVRRQGGRAGDAHPVLDAADDGRGSIGGEVDPRAGPGQRHEASVLGALVRIGPRGGGRRGHARPRRNSATSRSAAEYGSTSRRATSPTA